MRKPLNPFLLTGYHSPEYFCDREDELKWMRDQFQNERNMVIHAWRRIGKTSIIRHFFHQLEEERKVNTVFVDLLGTHDLEQAIKKITDAIIQQYYEKNKGAGKKFLQLIASIGASMSFDPITGLPSIDLNLKKGAEANIPLRVLGEFIQQQKETTLIAIDEFQQITGFPESNSEAVFRSWMQEFPMIRFIFSGSNRNMMDSMFREESRPFYKSAQILHLEHIPGSKYIPFIIHHFETSGKKMDRKRVNEILDWCQFQTYYVQLACNKLYGITDQVKESHLQKVFNEMLEQESPFFSSLQNLFTHYQWKLLIAIAKSEFEKNPMSYEFLQKHGLGPASSANTALKSLLKKEFIIADDDGYRLHDTLLMRWLQII